MSINRDLHPSPRISIGGSGPQWGVPGLPPQNVLLAGLPQADRERVLALARPVKLRARDVLYRAGEPIRNVHFVIQGICSLVTVMQDGSVLEVGMVGREGAVGIAATFAGTPLPTECWVQVVPCEAFVVPSDVINGLIGTSAPLRERLHRYSQALFAQAMQSAACNAHHVVLQRCCRWLLMTHDRVASPVLRVTHELIGMMLGVRRASVSEVSEQLQAEGIIRNSPGQIEILDRPALERRSCECYHVVRAHFQSLLS
jgi:CRP-like cAMP-binding protein